MQVLFEREQRAIAPTGAHAINENTALTKNIEELGDADEEFATTLLEGAVSLEEELKGAIETHAPEWNYDKMDPIARPVLLMGCFELLHADVPPAVVMNEYIEIAKEYGTEETGKFVNGVLNAVAHQK